MRLRVTILLIVICLCSHGLWAQDDSVEEVEAGSLEQKDLKAEQDFLDFETSFITAVQERSKDKPEKALEYLNKCEEIYPDHLALMYEKAKTYFDLHNYNQSHHYCDKVIKSKPDFIWAKILKRDLYVSEQNFQEAIAIQKSLYECCPNQAYDLVKLYVKVKNIEAGKQLLYDIDKKAIYIPDVDFYKKFFNIESLEEGFTVKEPSLDDSNDDDKPINTPVQPKQQTTESIFTTYDNLLQTNKYQDLHDLTQKAVFNYPTQPIHYLYQGMALIGLKKYDKANNMLELGLDFVFDDSNLKKRFYNQLITSYKALNQQPKVNYYQRLVQQLPE